MRPRDRGFVYFISDGAGAIKVGWSVSVDHRLADLQTASAKSLTILARFKGTGSCERGLHRHLRQHRIKGEWFSDCAETRAVIAELQKWHRFINGRDRTVIDVLRGKIESRMPWLQTARPSPERAAFAKWLEANEHRLTTPEAAKVADLCQRDFDLLDRYGRYPAIRRIVARDFERLNALVS